MLYVVNYCVFLVHPHVVVHCAKEKLVAGTPEFVRQLSERKFTEYV